MTYGHTLRRFIEHTPPGNPWAIASDHPSARKGTTRYPKTVRSARYVERILKSGVNSRKIGGKIIKGVWAGMPIYTLTLEERATCPHSCAHWLDCYGNKMHWAWRFKHGPALEAGLAAELALYQHLHPKGFVVRLHVLGDFYSVEYVSLWREWLLRFPALHVFGYTAWQPDTKIGAAVHALATSQWSRFAVRRSNGGGSLRCTVSIQEPSQAGAAVVCPAQTDKTECCGTCGLCWTTEKNIAFLLH